MMIDKKRSKIRFLYYISYCVFGPILKFAGATDRKIRESQRYIRHFYYSVNYKDWRIFMEDVKHTDKQCHDFMLYMPSIMAFVTFMVLVLL